MIDEEAVSWLLLTVIVLAGLAFRLSPMLWTRDFWYDEAFTGVLLKSPWGEMNRMIFADVHPPLYYWLAKPIASLFGYSPFGIRLLSVFASMAGLLSINWIGKKMFSWQTGLMASIFFAFSPFAIQYAQEARMYAVFGLFMLWSAWFFYRALSENRTRDWVLWGIFGGLSFLTHYLSLFFFLTFYGVFVAWRIVFDRKNKWAAFLGERGFWIGTGTILIFFLAWVKIFIAHMMKGNLGWIDPTYLSTLPSTLQIFLFGHPPGTGGMPSSNAFRYFFDGSTAGLLLMVLVAVLIALNWKNDRKRKESLFLSGMSFGVMILLIVLSHLDIKLYVARYFMPVAMMMYILLSGSILTAFGEKRGIYWTAFVFLSMILLLKPIPYDTDWNQISELRKSGDLGSGIIIASDAFAYSTARYYFGEDAVRYYNKNNPQEDFSGWVIVGNENRIGSTDSLEKIQGGNIVDQTCDWSGLRLKEIARTRRLSVCRIEP